MNNRRKTTIGKFRAKESQQELLNKSKPSCLLRDFSLKIKRPIPTMQVNLIDWDATSRKSSFKTSHHQILSTICGKFLKWAKMAPLLTFSKKNRLSTKSLILPEFILNKGPSHWKTILTPWAVRSKEWPPGRPILQQAWRTSSTRIQRGTFRASPSSSTVSIPRDTGTPKKMRNLQN